jgi:PAS domain S-box-containing protein
MTVTPTPMRTPVLGSSADPRPAGDRPRNLADLAERMPMGLIAFASDGRLLQFNPMAHLLLGEQGAPREGKEQLIARLGPTCADLANLVPGNRQVVVCGGRLIEIEAQSTPDGGLIWFLQDRSAEMRLRSQLSEEASFLAHSHEAFMVVDQHGFIRYANHFCERERGYDTNALIGRNLAQVERLCSPSYEDPREIAGAELRTRLQAVVKDGSPMTYNAWHRRVDGGEIPVEATLRPHRMSYETVVLLTARDDSRRLLHLQALVHAKAEAEAASRAKSAFLAVTSHELRTPLTGIMGFCELLQLEFPNTTGDAGKYLQMITESSQSLLAIINDIVDLSKIESRTLEIRPGPVDADQVLDTTAQLWRERAEAKGLTLVRKPSKGAPGRIITDPQRLRQMLDSLVSNAVKFTDRGEIHLSLEHVPDGIELTIQDTGGGIPTDIRESVFQAFWQAADHHTRATGGQGLGLYICRNLAELLGGRAWLESSSPSGSVFKLRLPHSTTARLSGRMPKAGDLFTNVVKRT